VSRINFAETSWGRMLDDPTLLDPSSRSAKVFRNKFRIPPDFFKNWLLPKLIEINVFGCKKKKDGSSRISKISFEFKVLACLRILATGILRTDLEDITSIGAATLDYLFKTFVFNVSRRLFQEFIYIPEDGDELEKICDAYKKLGFPGCFGSMDCTHVRWWNCPADEQNAAIGKEGYPTLAFQVLVDHGRRILHCSKAFLGRLNDINICSKDPVVFHDKYGLLSSLGTRRNKMKNLKFELFESNGSRKTFQGGWVITDGGYPPLSIFANPKIDSFSRAAVCWAEWCESIRKDVECTFGMLKHRWRLFLVGTRYTDATVIEAAFHTACILHNMLLLIDRTDIRYWNTTTNYCSGINGKKQRQ